LRETKSGTVEVYVNGEKKAELNSVKEGLVQIATFRDKSKEVIQVQTPSDRVQTLNYEDLAKVRARL
jgi:hypothetical protein